VADAPAAALARKPTAKPATKAASIPIIIVPEGLSAIVNMYNARQLLEVRRGLS